MFKKKSILWMALVFAMLLVTGCGGLFIREVTAGNPTEFTWEYAYDELDDREYTVYAVLVDQDTGIPIEVDGREVNAQMTFEPDGPGTIELVFFFDSSGLAGTTASVYVYLTDADTGTVVDKIEDLDQRSMQIRFVE